jgi:anti-sigma B factor antagonist
VSDRPHEPPAADDLTIERHRIGDALVLVVAGEIDMRTAPALSAALAGMLDSGPCILDLTQVGFLGSHGLSTLVNASRHAADLRIVVDANRPVIRPIELAGLDEILALYHTIDEAVAAHAS